LRENARQVCFYLCVGEAQEAEAVGGEDAVSLSVVILSALVDAAVHFDREPRAVAKEVGDKAVNDLLPPEVQAVQAAGPQMLPQRPFSRRHLTPHLTRQLLLLVGVTARDDKSFFHKASMLPCQPSDERHRPKAASEALPFEGRVANL